MADMKDAADGPVDLEAMIAAFLEDDSQTSMELPLRLTSEQRREAKRLVDQHPNLKCESYGLKEERRLHIFKTLQDRVRVKNTFIDDWAASAEGGEPPAFRSMPPSMPVELLERTLQRCAGVGQSILEVPMLAGIKESTGSDAGQPDRSPTAESTVPELPPLPEGFKVRNTFIHIESVPIVERFVQSMPDGMFRQCLEAELSAQHMEQKGCSVEPAEPAESATAGCAAAPASSLLHTPAPAAPVAADAEPHLAPGTEVIIQGLIKLPDFNGLTGVIQSLDIESGRYDVLLDGPAASACGWRWVKVKRDNCRPCMPPPPRNAPTLSMDYDRHC